MTLDGFIAARRAAGFRLHGHDGVWWENDRWGYCRPAVAYQVVDPAHQRPAWTRSAIGYVHRIPAGRRGSGYWHAVMMTRDRIQNYGLDRVDGKRRNCIRKGLKNCRVEPVPDLAPWRKDMTEIAKSTAVRNQRGFPPDYYDTHNDEWWNGITGMRAYTEFWGTFCEGRMAAYLAVHVAGPCAMINGAKSASEFLNANPNDALVHAFLESCRERGTVEEIFYGHWSEDKPTLNQFKTSFGFSGEKVPFVRRLLFGCVTVPDRSGAGEAETGDE